MGTRGPVSQLKLPSKLRLVTDKTADTSSMQAKVSLTQPAKPEGLPDELSELWDTLVSQLDDAGLIAAIDGPTLELGIRHYLAAVKASDDLLSGGSTMYDNKNEREMKNPASQVFRDHSTAFLEFAKQLGLSFVARARTSVAKEDADGNSNPFAING